MGKIYSVWEIVSVQIFTCVHIYYRLYKKDDKKAEKASTVLVIIEKVSSMDK